MPFQQSRTEVALSPAVLLSKKPLSDQGFKTSAERVSTQAVTSPSTQPSTSSTSAVKPSTSTRIRINRPNSSRVIEQRPPSMDRAVNKKVIIGGVVVALVAIIVGIVMLVKSYSTLEYYEFGFKRQKSTGEVNLDKVYRGGKSWFGPDYDFLVYRADAHFLDLVKIDIFTRDKLEISMSAHMQYFLREDELPLLHTKFNVYYEEVMVNSAEDALKGAVPVFTTRDLINNRSVVETVLHTAIRQRLGGVCCRPDCSQYALACPAGCKRFETCTNDDKGHHVDVEHFTLGKYYIPEPVESRFMESLVLQEKAIREELVQNASVIRKETEAMVKEIKNIANEIKQNATAEANLIRNVAWADYDKTRETARILGLANSLNTLNITDEQKKISFDYFRTLMKNKNIHLSVDFETLIAGKLKDNS